MDREEAIDYIQGRIDSGFEKDVIVDSLLHNGYSYDEAERLYERVKEDFRTDTSAEYDDGRTAGPLTPVKMLFSKQFLQVPVFGYVFLAFLYSIATFSFDWILFIMLPFMFVAFIRFGRDVAFYIAVFYIVYSLVFSIGIGILVSTA